MPCLLKLDLFYEKLSSDLFMELLRVNATILRH